MGTAVARTVTGDIAPERMGITLSHEHLFIDGGTWWVEPATTDDRLLSEREPRIEDLWWLRQWPNTSRSNLLLDDCQTAIAEIGHFRAYGGQTVVDLTPDRTLGRAPLRLRDIAAATGVQILCGTGFYVEQAHPPFVAAATAENLAQHMIRDIVDGIEDTGIRAGVIGEIGVSHPVSKAEQKVLTAAAEAQRETGAAISIHTAYEFPEAYSALVVADILAAAGADLSRVAMGHMDTALRDPVMPAR
jgi:phosphotriesterase-related protein